MRAASHEAGRETCLGGPGKTIAFGIAVGQVVGVAQYLFVQHHLSMQVIPEILYALGLFGLAGAVVGAGLSAAWPGFAILGLARRNRPGFPAIFSVHAAFFAILVAADALNQWSGMPPPTSRTGLVYNGALFLVGIALGVGLYRALVRISADRWDSVWRRFRPVAFLLAAAPAALVVIWGVGGMELAMKDRPPATPDMKGAGRPSVLLLVIDSLRKDHLSGYGYERATSPVIDGLMREGVTFENAFAQSNWTLPSVASLETGVTPTTHGTRTLGRRFPESLTTLAEALGEAGYYCGFFSSHPGLDEETGYHDGFRHVVMPEEQFWFYRKQTAIERVAVKALRPPLQKRDARLLDQVSEWICGHRGTPLFAYVHLMEVHMPYDPPPPYDTLFDSDYAGRRIKDPSRQIRRPNLPEDEWWDWFGWDEMEPGVAALPERTRFNMIALYDGEIAYADSLVGAFMDRLRRTGFYDGAFVALTADHGEEFYEHKGWGHGHSIFDELLRVPLIVKLPQGSAAGVVRMDAVCGIDLLPTILTHVGIDVPPEAEGIDILSGSAGGWQDRPILSERPPYMYSVRVGEWKLIRRKIRTGAYVSNLFDLEEDPAEGTDLVSAYPGTVDSLARILSPRIPECDAEPENSILEPHQREKLRALGYIQ